MEIHNFLHEFDARNFSGSMLQEANSLCGLKMDAHNANFLFSLLNMNVHLPPLAIPYILSIPSSKYLNDAEMAQCMGFKWLPPKHLPFPRLIDPPHGFLVLLSSCNIVVMVAFEGTKVHDTW